MYIKWNLSVLPQSLVPCFTSQTPNVCILVEGRSDARHYCVNAPLPLCNDCMRASFSEYFMAFVYFLIIKTYYNNH